MVCPMTCCRLPEIAFNFPVIVPDVKRNRHIVGTGEREIGTERKSVRGHKAQKRFENSESD